MFAETRLINSKFTSSKHKAAGIKITPLFLTHFDGGVSGRYARELPGR
jgi:hypothetical protein